MGQRGAHWDRPESVISAVRVHFSVKIDHCKGGVTMLGAQSVRDSIFALGRGLGRQIVRQYVPGDRTAGFSSRASHFMARQIKSTLWCHTSMQMHYIWPTGVLVLDRNFVKTIKIAWQESSAHPYRPDGPKGAWWGGR